MKNLITGIHGFAASHLADLLLDRGEEVFGLARTLDRKSYLPPVREEIRVYPCDMSDSTELEKVLEAVCPQRIYHLAAVTFVPAAAENWNLVFDTNFFGTLNLLEKVKHLKMKTRILWVGSSEEYGVIAKEEGPVKEGRPLNPRSLYGVSKASADFLARSYFERDGLDILRVRPFNHIGPRQDSRFFCSSVGRQIAGFEAGAEPVMRTGNLDSFRDFTDVRDTVGAYLAIMEQGRAGEVFNVCSGREVSMRSVVDCFLRMTQVSVRVETDPKRYRVEEPANVRGDPSFLQNRTGWCPKISFEQTLRDILHFWREVIKSGNVKKEGGSP